MPVVLRVENEPTPPVRGLLATRNRKGAGFATVDLQRWMRLSRIVFHTIKADVLCAHPVFDLFEPLLEHAAHLDMRLSLRTAGETGPPDLEAFRRRGLLDVFLCPAETRLDRIEPWLQACRDADLPLRAQFQAPFDEGFDEEEAAARLADAGTTAVNIAVADPFLTKATCLNAEDGERTAGIMNRFASALAGRGVEANLVGLPFCRVPEALWPAVKNSRQFFRDHQQYAREAYALALRLWDAGPLRARLLLLMLLNRYTSERNPIDAALLPWVLDRPWLRARVWALHKLTRGLRALRRERRDAASPPPEVILENPDIDRAPTPVDCQGCRFERVCDHGAPPLPEVLPGLDPHRVKGVAVVSAMQFARAQRKHYDVVDETRRTRDTQREELGRAALEIVMGRPPDGAVDSFAYGAEEGETRQMPGGVRWYSFANAELRSTVLTRLSTPVTLAATFGEGTADLIGFGFGRSCRVMCPMEAFAHRLVLHVTADGRYVLLRDGVVMRPERYRPGRYVPSRLGNVLEPRLVVRNIDGTLVTQGVCYWTDPEAEPVGRAPARYSVVMVCARYSRRLAAALAALARQEGARPGEIEAIVAHVPGVDATEDVLDSVETAWPHLRVVRAPFAPERAQSKGLMINEAARLATGAWVLLLDADIILPPGMLRALDALPEAVRFAAPEGRKMLTREETARILLGETDPYRDWRALMNGPGEYRFREAFGVPIGFCQCVRAACLREVAYEEHGHFGGADYRFGMEIQARHGPAVRMDGVSVLHLDHAGSQWYGTHRQF